MKVPAGPCPECGECPRPPPRHRRDTLGRHLQTGQHARPLHHPGPLPLHEVAASPVHSELYHLLVHILIIKYAFYRKDISCWRWLML